MVYVWCLSLVSYYSALPLINSLKKSGKRFKIVVLNNHVSLATFYFRTQDIIAYDTLTFGFKFKVLRFFERLFHHLFIDYSKDKMYLNQYVRKNPKFWKLFGLKTDNPSRYVPVFRKLFSSYSNPHFKDVQHIVFSYEISSLSSLHFQNCRYTPLVVMESWDHPVKYKWLMPENTKVFSWNDDLLKDIRDLQLLENGIAISPLKFRYIDEYGTWSDESLLKAIKEPHLKEECDFIVQDRVLWVYPFSTSGGRGKPFQEELKLVEAIIEKLPEGQALLIKPKPQGGIRDFDSLRKYENDFIKIGAEPISKEFIDLFSDDYNMYRYLLLKHCDCMINFGTTLVLEGAIMDASILQICELEPSRYEFINKLLQNYHMQKYLIQPLEDQIHSVNELFDEKHLSSGAGKLYKQWVTNGTNKVDTSDSINKIMSHIDV